MCNHKTRQAATRLLWLSIVGIVVGAPMTWRYSGPFGWDGPAHETTGIGGGWGLYAIGLVAVLAVIQDRYGWTRRVAGSVLAGGLVLTAGVVWLTGRFEYRGGGVYMTVLAGLLVLLSGGIGLAATIDYTLPRPLAGVGPPRRVRRALATVGAALVLLQFPLLRVIPRRLSREYASVPAVFAALVADLFSGWLVLFAVGVMLIGAIRWAWSRILGGMVALLGVLFVLSVLPVYTGRPLLIWGPGSVYGNDPFVVLPVLLGGTALLLAGVLELGSGTNSKASASDTIDHS